MNPRPVCGELSFLGRLLRVDLIKWVSNVRPPSCTPYMTYVRQYIRPQKVSSISMKYGMYVEVDEWCMTVCSMTRSKVMVKVTSPWKSEIQPFSKAISSPIYNGLASDHGFLNYGAIPKAYRGRIFYFCFSFCVTWIWSWH